MMIMDGMLWYDDSATTVEEKLTRAKSYYTKKYGEEPNVCYVDPGMVEKETQIAGMKVVPTRRVMRLNLFIGRE